MEKFIEGFVCGGALFFLLGLYVQYRHTKDTIKEARQGLQSLHDDLDAVRKDIPAFLRKQAE